MNSGDIKTFDPTTAIHHWNRHGCLGRRPSFIDKMTADNTSGSSGLIQNDDFVAAMSNMPMYKRLFSDYESDFSCESEYSDHIITDLDDD